MISLELCMKFDNIYTIHTWIPRYWHQLFEGNMVSRGGFVSKVDFLFSKFVWSLKNSSVNGSSNFLFFDDSNSSLTSVLGVMDSALNKDTIASTNGG